MLSRDTEQKITRGVDSDRCSKKLFTKFKIFLNFDGGKNPQTPQHMQEAVT